MKNDCKSVKAQAVAIANAVLRKQNKRVFREMLNYLVRSKFLIGLTEIKLTRALRKRIFALMESYNDLHPDQLVYKDKDFDKDDDDYSLGDPSVGYEGTNAIEVDTPVPEEGHMDEFIMPEQDEEISAPEQAESNVTEINMPKSVENNVFEINIPEQP